MGVHWGGYPLDLDKIRDIRAKFRGKIWWAALIEDGKNMHLVLSTKESI